MTDTPPTSHQTRIRYLDGWRGISILLVLAGHFAPVTGPARSVAETIAAVGVEFFFVLSGRLMADILFVERFPLREFYKRRFSRIYPGAAVFVLLVWIATSRSSLAFKPAAVAAALTFTINYAMILQHGVAAIENLWSLCIEEHAYVLLGLLAFVIRRRGGSPLPALIAASALSITDAVVSTLVFHQEPRTVHWRSDAHVSSIFMASAAYLMLRDRKAPAWVPLVCAAVGLGIAIFGGDLLRFTLATAFLAAAVATLDHAPKPVRTAMSWAPLAQAGMWSYSVYLWQQPFYRLMFDGVLPDWAAIALAVGAGLASFYVVEQPARRWLNANIKVRRTAPAPRAAAAGAPPPRPIG